MAKLKYFILAILALVFVVFVHPYVMASEQPAQLTERGHQLLNQGKPQEAFKVWGKALKQYEQDQNQKAVVGTKVNQSLALSALGQPPRACNTLTTALELEGWICDTQEPHNEEQLKDELSSILSQPETLLATESLGRTLYQLGKSEESIQVLEHSRNEATALSMDATSINLSLGNAYFALYRQKLNQYQLSESHPSLIEADQSIQAAAKSAQTLYRLLLEHSDPKVVLKAQLNLLELLQGFDPTIDQLKDLDEQSKTQIPLLVNRIQTADFSLLSPIDSIYARLKFANSLITLQQNLESADHHIQAAAQIAQKIQNKRATAASGYYSGKLYQQTGQTIQAEQVLKNGASLATSIQAWDLAYQNNAELAKLLQEKGDIAQSRQAYKAAISNLDEVRTSLLAVDHPFSYREEIEPIHRRYMQLLLSASKPDLKEVIATNEQLQISQVENFLRCGRLDVVSLEKLREQTETPTVIHILQLEDQVHILVSSDKGIHQYSAPAEPILEQVDFLGINIENNFDRTGVVILEYASSLYKSLIAPIKEYLPNDGTLIFVLDENFQSIPMAMLWDGRQFLVENYAIANALGSKVARPQSLPKEQLNVLFAGLSEISPSQQNSDDFTPQKALPFVKDEVKRIDKFSESTDEILNSAFTAQRLQDELARVNSQILHISTHGQFSSKIGETLIWAWDKTINLSELETLLRRRGDNQPLNLLILSACQSAEGDKRATLGMAGIAAQAGAKSTLASLWLVDDASTALFMESFYERLQSGETKAEALRAAQLSLIDSDLYRHPFFWASFLLIGSWV